jgi:indole-3-glycerol phosphate synthase
MEVEPVVVPYNTFGAAGISILTESNFFAGDLDDLIQTKIITDVPVLRKDFIIDPWQVAESKAFGADVILLIAACLQPTMVKELAGYAKEIGLEVILEIHDETELGHICEGVDMIGINNRNLKTFEVDINTSLALIAKLPTGLPAIAESGINEPDTVITLRKAGFKGFLVGESFMKTADPGLAFEHFVVELKAR